MKSLNLYGSTGTIGKNVLNIIDNYFPKIKINLLCVNKNINLLLKQIVKYKPKYVYIENEYAREKLKKNKHIKVKILSLNELNEYLISSKSNYSILSVSGYNSLKYLEPILKNTKNLGIVSKEAIVSAGHLFKKLNFTNKTNIFPIDSEHFSLHYFFKYQNISNYNIRKIYLTASGGPFLGKKFHTLNKIKFSQAIKHPKWNMGYKNSIDSATMVNKCLEIIEAHYLFNISFDKIDILVHPQSIVHSVIEQRNYISSMILFKNDMKIPIKNFFFEDTKNFINYDSKFYYDFKSELHFSKIKISEFPVYNYFMKLDKERPINIINFNIANEIAVDLFKNNKILYTDIYKFIRNTNSLNLNYNIKNIKGIIEYHEKFEKKLYEEYNSYI